MSRPGPTTSKAIASSRPCLGRRGRRGFVPRVARILQRHDDGAATARNHPRLPQPVFILGAPRSRAHNLIDGALGARPVRAAARIGSRAARRGAAPVPAGPPGCLVDFDRGGGGTFAVLRNDCFARAEAAGLTGPGARLFPTRRISTRIRPAAPAHDLPRSEARPGEAQPHAMSPSRRCCRTTCRHGFNCAYRIEDIVGHLAATRHRLDPRATSA